MRAESSLRRRSPRPDHRASPASPNSSSCSRPGTPSSRSAQERRRRHDVRRVLALTPEPPAEPFGRPIRQRCHWPADAVGAEQMPAARMLRREFDRHSRQRAVPAFLTALLPRTGEPLHAAGRVAVVPAEHPPGVLVAAVDRQRVAVNLADAADTTRRPRQLLTRRTDAHRSPLFTAAANTSPWQARGAHQQPSARPRRSSSRPNDPSANAAANIRTTSPRSPCRPTRYGFAHSLAGQPRAARPI